MLKNMKVSLLEMLIAISDTVDLMKSMLVGHHLKVAYIAVSLGEELKLSSYKRDRLLAAGILHDIGALSEKERLDALEFEFKNPMAHALVGYHLLKPLDDFLQVADIVRYHHLPWENGRGGEDEGKPVPLASHIINLADRLSILIDPRREVLLQKEEIMAKINAYTPHLFHPLLVEALSELAASDSFWLDIVYPKINILLRQKTELSSRYLEEESLFRLADLFRGIIDFKSSFTANHSGSVAKVAENLASLVGFSLEECKMIKIAGDLHDLGKLAIPREILDKPGKLTAEERKIMQKHAYYSYRTLDNIDDFDLINLWASLHHERLDGSGYPFGLKKEKLPLGSRIIAVADVFTALSENRPYREALSFEEISSILQKMAEENALDKDIAFLLLNNYDFFSSLLNSLAVCTEEK